MENKESTATLSLSNLLGDILASPEARKLESILILFGTVNRQQNLRAI